MRDRIETHVKRITHPNTIEGVLKHIELIGRVSHRSEERITDKSYIPFVENMKKLKHYSTLIHGYVYLSIPYTEVKEMGQDKEKQLNAILENKYSSHVRNPLNLFHITTNIRILNEETNSDYDWFLKYMVEPIEFHDKAYTYEIFTSIDISREMNRHDLGILEESTRYVDYSKERHGKEIRIGKSILEETLTEEQEKLLNNAYSAANFYYITLKELGVRNDIARKVLPLGASTKVYYTAPLSKWKDFISKRDIPSAHPDIRIIAQMIKEDLKEELNR